MRESVFGSSFEFLGKMAAAVFTLIETSMRAIPYVFGTGENRKKVTEQYPDPVSSRTEDDLPAQSRGQLVNDIDRCNACGDCRRICPVECIRIETLPTDDIARPTISVFDIDLGRCLYCGLCVEVCHPGSLTHSKKFEGAVYRSSDLILSFGKGKYEST